MGNDQVGKIIITATFTAEPVNESLSFLLRKIGNESTVEFTAHNQVFQQLLDPSSLFATNRDGVNILLLRLEDWYRFVGPAEPPTAIGPLLRIGMQTAID